MSEVGTAPRIVVAPDKFKGTLTAAQAATAIEAGIRAVVPEARTTALPVADGGEGTIDALVAAGATEHLVTVTGPLDEPTLARFAVHGATAFIESAQACGLQLVEPTPASALRAHSKGVGELLLAALDVGVERIVVGLGGVACTDGGGGMAQVLGAQLLDRTGRPVVPGGVGLVTLGAVDLTGLDPRLHDTALVAATDVTNPLTGATGAAHVYGPQKGAGRAEVAVLERGLARLARVLESTTGESVDGVAGSGAAGGLAAGMVAMLGAGLASGCELVLHLLQVARCIDGADLVVTGEGKLDAQSFFGKAPVGVASLARRYGVPVVAIAGVVEGADDGALEKAFDACWSLTDEVGPLALSAPAEALTCVAERMVRRWLAE